MDERYAVHVEATFRTEAQRNDVAIEAMAPFAETSCAFDATLSLSFSRSFRDGSLGHLVRFDSATLRSGDVTLPLDLSGRSVELRRFGDGEILDVALMGYAIGPSRLLDVFDLVFPLVSPFPPDLERPGDEAPRLLSWPVHDEEGNGWYNRAQLQWTFDGLEDADDGTRAFELSYAGPWSAEGNDVWNGETPVALAGGGEVKGRVQYDDSSRALLRHDFDWHRQVIWRHGEGGERVTVRQDQRFLGSVSRPGGAP